MELKDKLRKLREELNFKQIDIAKKLNIPRTTYNNYETGFRTPDYELLKKIAELYDVSTDYLLGKSNIKNQIKENFNTNNFIKLPIIKVIKAGEPLLTIKNIIGYDYIPIKSNNNENCFFLKIIDDSMNLSRILEGDLVLVIKQEKIENGEIAVILVDKENATIKRYYKADNIITLMPNSSNPEHKPRVIDSKITNIKVIGKVIRAIINF